MYKTSAAYSGYTLTSEHPRQYSYFTMYKTGAAYSGCTQTSEHPKQFSIIQCTKLAQHVLVVQTPEHPKQYSTEQCTKPAYHTLVVHRHQSILNNTVQYNLQRSDFLTKSRISDFTI